MKAMVVPYHPIANIETPDNGFPMSECDHISALELAEKINPEYVIGYGCGAIYALEVAYRRPTVKGVIMINPTVNHHCTAWADPVVCEMLVISGSLDEVAPQEDVFRRLCWHGALGFMDEMESRVEQYHCKDTGERELVGYKRVTSINMIGMPHDVKGFEDQIRKAIEEWVM